MSTAPSEPVQEQGLSLLQEDVVEVEESVSRVRSAVEDFPVRSWQYKYVKRLMDVSCAFMMAALLFIPGLLIAVAIVLTSRGPIFYRELRVGRNGRPFRIWKFRSMRQNAHRNNKITNTSQSGRVLEWRMHKHVRDPRITPIGGFLRRWSLDEIPQLINVLLGEMSLIGPRPIVKKETMFYGDFMAHYLAVNPGMSGLWQVSGRSHVHYEKRVLMDAFYVESWSLGADFRILLRTIPAVLSRRGAV